MNDLISRQAAIAVADYSDYVGLSVDDVKKVTDEVVKGLRRLPSAQPVDVVEVVRCEKCIHAKQHSYAPAECQWYCTISLQYHGGRFFCACGERGTDLLEWIHRGDDDEQGV